MHLSEKLRILTAAYELTQEQLGTQLGIAQTTVSRWLKGDSRPYDRHARKLAQIFQIPVEDLIDDSRELPMLKHSPEQPIEEEGTEFSRLLTAIREQFYIPLEADLSGRTPEEAAQIDRVMTEAVEEMERRRSAFMKRLMGAAEEAGLKIKVGEYRRFPRPASPPSSAKTGAAKLEELKSKAAGSAVAPPLPQPKPARRRNVS